VVGKLQQQVERSSSCCCCACKLSELARSKTNAPDTLVTLCVMLCNWFWWQQGSAEFSGTTVLDDAEPPINWQSYRIQQALRHTTLQRCSVGQHTDWVAKSKGLVANACCAKHTVLLLCSLPPAATETTHFPAHARAVLPAPSPPQSCVPTYYHSINKHSSPLPQ